MMYEMILRMSFWCNFECFRGFLHDGGVRFEEVADKCFVAPSDYVNIVMVRAGVTAVTQMQEK